MSDDYLCTMMSPSTTQPSSRKLLVHTALSLLVLALGIALLIYMVTVESEPGALPLGLIVVGIGWFIFARWRLRPRAQRAAKSVQFRD